MEFKSFHFFTAKNSA